MTLSPPTTVSAVLVATLLVSFASTCAAILMCIQMAAHHPLPNTFVLSLACLLYALWNHSTSLIAIIARSTQYWFLRKDDFPELESESADDESEEDDLPEIESEEDDDAAEEDADDDDGHHEPESDQDRYRRICEREREYFRSEAEFKAAVGSFNVNHQCTETGNTLLHVIRQYYMPLLRAGANPNIQNHAGDTPLHTTCDRNKIMVLLPVTDLTLKNHAGFTVIDWNHNAAQIYHTRNAALCLPEIVRLLTAIVYAPGGPMFVSARDHFQRENDAREVARDVRAEEQCDLDLGGPDDSRGQQQQQ